MRRQPGHQSRFPGCPQLMLAIGWRLTTRQTILFSMRKLRFTRSVGLLVLFVSLTAPTWSSGLSTEGFDEIEKRVASLKRPRSTTELVQSIASLAQTEAQRAFAAYVWVARNVDYDVDAFFGGGGSASEADDVFRTGKSVCQGYSELYKSLLEKLGIEAVLITGYSKAFGYQAGKRLTNTDHAWNAFKVDGNWYLAETTWAAGHVSGSRFVSDYTRFWFATSPEIFAYNHQPQDSAWLLTSKKRTLREYEQEKYVETYVLKSLFEAGYSPQEQAQVLAHAPLPQYFHQYAQSFKAIGGDVGVLARWLEQKAVPTIWSYEGQSITLLEYPQQSPLRIGQSYRFSMKILNCTAAAVISGGEFSFLKREGDVFSGEVKVKNGELRLSAQITNKGQQSYWPVLVYQSR